MQPSAKHALFVTIRAPRTLIGYMISYLRLGCVYCEPTPRLFEIPIIEMPHIRAGTRLHPLVLPAWFSLNIDTNSGFYSRRIYTSEQNIMVDIVALLAKCTSVLHVDDSMPIYEGTIMDVRLHRASKAAALTLLIIFTTALVSFWLNNPQPPISWEMYGHVSYIDTIFSTEIPASSDISYDVDIDDSQNTTRIYVEIDTELNMSRGKLGFRMESTYITPHSWYSVADNQEASLSSRSSSEYWNATSYHNLPFGGLGLLGLNESVEKYHVFHTEYSLQMIWNSSLTLVEERDNDTSFDLHLDFHIHFSETQIQVDPALFGIIFFVECIVGITMTVGLYKIDEPELIE